MNPIASFMRDRSEAERRAAMGLASVVIIVLLAALVWLPLERTRARLAAELPALRASIDKLQRDAGEVKRLRAMPPAPSQAAPVAALATTPPTGAQVAALDARRVRLTSADAAFTTLLEWIVAAQASHGLHVESAKVDALAAPGRVKAEILMSRP